SPLRAKSVGTREGDASEARGTPVARSARRQTPRVGRTARRPGSHVAPRVSLKTPASRPNSSWGFSTGSRACRDSAVILRAVLAMGSERLSKGSNSPRSTDKGLSFAKTVSASLGEGSVLFRQTQAPRFV